MPPIDPEIIFSKNGEVPPIGLPPIDPDDCMRLSGIDGLRLIIFDEDEIPNRLLYFMHSLQNRPE